MDEMTYIMGIRVKSAMIERGYHNAAVHFMSRWDTFYSPNHRRFIYARWFS